MRKEVDERDFKVEKNYTFEMFWEDLDNGYRIYYTYMDCRYLIYKFNLFMLNFT